jgi:integrase
MEGGKYRKAALGTADDYADSDGSEVLAFGQAQAVARRFFDRARVDAGEESPQRGPFKVSDAWRLYLEEAKRLGRRTPRMECAWKLYIGPELGGLEVERMTRTRIASWLDKVAKSAPHRRSKRFGPSIAQGPMPETKDGLRKRGASANRILAVLKAMLTHAWREGRVPSDAAWRAVKPLAKVDQPRTRFLTLEEQQRLVNASEPDFRRLVQGGLFTGARVQELASIRGEDFNPASGTVWIEPGKTGRGRHVILTEEGQAFFHELTAGLKSSDLAFTHEAFDGRTWKDAKIQRAWKKAEHDRPTKAACKAAGLEPLGFHTLRHTYASMLLNRGVTLTTLADQLGHADTRMVQRVYGHLCPSAKKNEIRTLAPKLGIFTPGKVEGLRINHG